MTPDEPSFDSASPAPELFGPAWADRLERELAVNEPYRAAAASWKGSLAFELQPDGTPGFPVGRGLFLDLAHGSCHTRFSSARAWCRRTFLQPGSDPVRELETTRPRRFDEYEGSPLS